MYLGQASIDNEEYYDVTWAGLFLQVKDFVEDGKVPIHNGGAVFNDGSVDLIGRFIDDEYTKCKPYNMSDILMIFNSKAKTFMKLMGQYVPNEIGESIPDEEPGILSVFFRNGNSGVDGCVLGDNGDPFHFPFGDSANKFSPIHKSEDDFVPDLEELSFQHN